jgi:tetratricopeptide (TPR) repeat protein
LTGQKGSSTLIKNIFKLSAAVALSLAIATSALSQDTPAADKRAQALKKYLEAQNLEKAGNYPAAVAAYKEAITLDPTSAELKTALGSLYLKHRNVIEAEAQAREAARLAPNDLGVRKLLAQIYLSQVSVGGSFDKGKATSAIRELEEITRTNAQAKIDLGGNEPVPALAVVAQLYLSLEEEDKAIESLKRLSDGDASSTLATSMLAEIYYNKGKYREAAAAARKAYEANPQSTAAAGLLAKALLRIDRGQEALSIYKKAIGIKDTPPGEESKEGVPLSPLTFDYAEALIETGRYDEAIKKVIDPLLANVRRDSEVFLHLTNMKGRALRRQGNREEAARVLEAALKGQDVSESLVVVYSLAETYEEIFRFDKAVETYEDALAAIINPDGTVSGSQNERNAGVILRRIAIAHRMAGNRDKMLETYDRMRKTLGPKSFLADQMTIEAHLNEGKDKEAYDLATSAAERNPDERSFKLYRAQAASKIGRLDVTDQIMKGLLKNGPEDADIYLFWSGVQLEANQLKQAEETVRKAMSLDPNDISPLITLSSIQERQNKHKEAEATLRRALEIDPDNATLLNNLGYFLADRGEKIPEAESLIRRAVNIEPTNGSFLDSLGWVLFKQNKIAEAQKYIEQAIVYSPRSATLHDHLGDIYKKQGLNDKARAKWEDALRLATEPEEIKKIKEKLGKK